SRWKLHLSIPNDISLQATIASRVGTRTSQLLGGKENADISHVVDGDDSGLLGAGSGPWHAGGAAGNPDSDAGSPASERPDDARFPASESGGAERTAVGANRVGLLSLW